MSKPLSTDVLGTGTLIFFSSSRVLRALGVEVGLLIDSVVM